MVVDVVTSAGLPSACSNRARPEVAGMKSPRSQQNNPSRAKLGAVATSDRPYAELQAQNERPGRSLAEMSEQQTASAEILGRSAPHR